MEIMCSRSETLMFDFKEAEDLLTIIEAVIEPQGITVKLREDTTYDELETKFSIKNLFYNEDTEIKPRDNILLPEHISNRQDKELLQVKYKKEENADRKPPVFIEMKKNEKPGVEQVIVPISKIVQIDIKQQMDSQDMESKLEEFHNELNKENESNAVIYIETDNDTQDISLKVEQLDDKPEVQIPVKYTQYKEDASQLQTKVAETEGECKIGILQNDEVCTTLDVDEISETYSKESLLSEVCSEEEIQEKKKMLCSLCRKSFTEKGLLVKHCLGHVGERPYHCVICNQTFKRVEFYNAHLLIHSREQPYSCSICKMTFDRKSYLDLHENAHAVKGPLICGMCDNTFSCRAYLVAHLRSHTNQRLYSCKVCKISFAQKADFDLHTLSHSEKKRLRCELCKKEFAKKQMLHRHEQIHAHDQFLCNYCHASFSLKNDLHVHLVRACTEGRRR